MDASSQQVIALYQQGMPVDIIAEQLGLELESVKLTVASKGGVSREEAETLFGKDTFTAARDVMGALLYEDDPHVKYRAAKFVINENKGRHDVKNLKEFKSINLTIINQRIARAREVNAKAKEAKPIDV